MSAPWMKFYPRDWRGDQALRAVSVAARGLWMECLCIMHEAKPYGHLVLNGAPVEADALARMTGVSVDEVSALLAELRQAGVLSMTSKGVVFSRRMTKDHARAQKGRKAANRRWSQASDDVQQSEEPNGLPNGDPITQKPEAREQKEEKGPDGPLSESQVSDAPKPSRKRNAYPPEFDALWAAYPVDQNMSKKEAFDAWKRLDDGDRTAVMASVPAFRAYCSKNPDYRPIHLCRYIQKRRFEGHGGVTVPKTAHRPAGWPSNMPDPEAAFLAWSNGHWPRAWGFPPDDPSCAVPADVLADWRRRLRRVA